MEFTLLAGAGIAVGAIYSVLWIEAGHTNAADCTRDLWDALLTATVAGVFAGRLGAMISEGTNPLTHPGDVLIVRGGVDPIVASVAALATFGWLMRADLWWLADAAAPAALAGLAGWQASCTVRGTCLGTRSDLPWAITETGGTVTRHPVDIYAAILLLLTLLALIWWKRHRSGSGAITGAALAAAAAARLITEPMRLGIGSDPAPWYLFGGVIGIALLTWRLRTAASTEDRRQLD